MATLCNLTAEYGLLKIDGSDAEKLLQGQLTCDVTKITLNKASLGAHCNPQGRVISLFYLFKWQDAYYQLMPKRMVPIALNALKKYAIFYKTTLSDASGQLPLFGCYHCATDHPSIDLGLGFHLFISDQPDFDAESSNTWHRLMLITGIPTIYPETTEKFLPHELNLPELQAVSFEKGCYTGQEIIARMHYKGKLKKHLYKAYLTSPIPPRPGVLVYTQENQQVLESGQLVDTINSEDNRYEALIITDEANSVKNFLIPRE